MGGAVPDLVVGHRDAVAARRTIERLSRLGVEGADLVLLGPGEQSLPGRQADRETDGASLRRLGSNARRGTLLGAVVGAVFGAVVLLTVPDVGSRLAATLIGAAGAGVGGAFLGLLVGLLATPTMVSAWERTFAPMKVGTVLVGVRVSDGDMLARLQEALAGSRAHEIRLVSSLDEVVAELARERAERRGRS